MPDKKDKKGKKYIVDMEIFRSGTAIDGRYASPKFLKEIFVNTTKFVLGRNVLVPVQLGHEPANEILQGKVVGLRMKGLAAPSLWAQVELYEDAYRAFVEGRLPARSIEFRPFGYTEGGQKFGPFLFALALLGSSPAALPNLKTGKIAAGKKYCANVFKDAIFYYSVNDGINRGGETKMTYDAEKLAEIKEMLAKIAILIQEMEGQDAPETEGDETAPEMDADKEKEKQAAAATQAASKAPETSAQFAAYMKSIEDNAAQYKAQAQRYEAQLAELEFEKLVAAGHLSKDGKEKFSSHVQKYGLDDAVGFYRGVPAQLPPNSKQTKSEPAGEDAEFAKAVEHIYRANGATPDEIKRYMSV